MNRRLPAEQLFHWDRLGTPPIGDETINFRLDALERAALADLLADPSATLPDCPLSQLEPLEAI